MIRTGARLLGFLAAVLILYGLQRTMPGYAEITGPIAVTGGIGDKLSARNFALTVDKVSLAREITVESFGRERTYTTSGLWALVEARAEAGRESVTVMAAQWLAPNGARYLMSGRLSNMPGDISSDRLEPGLPPRQVLLVFEFPEDQANGATLLVAQNAYTPLDSEIRIVIELDEPLLVANSARIARDGADWRMSMQ
ncbi:hypothetical protein [Mesorhizobium sp. 1B3]|uniref:hypothetical protein n=1 Tax=Mesorhizobium sp. 1B3 TaxID=3243599 RepID=UPI003D9671CE